MKLRKYNTKSQKLTTEQVRQLFNELSDGMTQGAAARKWGLSVIQVGRIARGESRAAETGAGAAPVPNFNRQFDSDEIAASQAKMLAMLEGQPTTETKVDAVEAFRAAARAKREAGEPTGIGLERLQRESASKLDELMTDDKQQETKDEVPKSE